MRANLRTILYCKLCGNETIPDVRGIGAECREQIKGPLRDAYRHFMKCAEDNPVCCSGINWERTSLYIHAKWWEGSYPLTKTGQPRKRGPYVWVEFGVNFHEDHATTYYIRDFDSYCDSVVYGDPIPYSDPEFWSKLNTQLDKAPEAAWNSDLLSCGRCGYHMTEPHGRNCGQ